MYLTTNDYKLRITDRRLSMILDDNMNLLQDAEETAIATIKDALHPYYDVDTIFSLTGNDRHSQVMRWVLNLVMYYIYERIPDKLVPQRVKDNYNDTTYLLFDIADGKKSVMLPTKTDEDTNRPATKFRWGSTPQRTHR